MVRVVGGRQTCGDPPPLAPLWGPAIDQLEQRPEEQPHTRPEVQ